MQDHELTAERVAVLGRRAQLRRLTNAIVVDGLILRENHAKWRAETMAGATFTYHWCDDTPATRRFIEAQRISKRKVYGALAELSLRNPQQVIAADAEARRLVRNLRRQLTAGIGTPRRETRRGPRPREHSVRSEPSRGPPDLDSELPSSRLKLDRFRRATRWLPPSLRAKLFLSLPSRLQRPFWTDLSDEIEHDRIDEMRTVAEESGFTHVSVSVEDELRRLLEEWSR